MISIWSDGVFVPHYLVYTEDVEWNFFHVCMDEDQEKKAW